MTRTSKMDPRRKEAVEGNHTHYFGNPCTRHPEHINHAGETLRYAKSGTCVTCCRQANTQYRSQKPNLNKDTYHRLKKAHEHLCGVYVIRQLNRWKFGVVCGNAYDHMRRYAFKNTAFGFEKYEEEFIPCATKEEAHQLENELHAIFNHRRLPDIKDESGGEWFEWESLYDYAVRLHNESPD